MKKPVFKLPLRPEYDGEDWRMPEHETASVSGAAPFCDADGQCVGYAVTTGWNDRDADRRVLIVKAVNAHDDLVAAAQPFVDILNTGFFGFKDHELFYDARSGKSLRISDFQRLAEALAKAEGVPMKTNEIDAASSSRSDMLRDVREKIEPTEWAWYASRDEETYDCGPEMSREAIIQAATYDFDGERFHILEGRQGPVDVAAYLSVEAVVEQIGEALYEDVGDPDGETVLLDPSRVATEALDGMLKAEIRRWQELHGIKVMSWTFTEIRSAEFIEPIDQALERAGGGDHG